VKSKEVEYANASAAIKSDNNKTNLFFMYEQEITKLNRQIHYANKMNVFIISKHIHQHQQQRQRQLEESSSQHLMHLLPQHEVLFFDNALDIDGLEHDIVDMDH